MVIKMKIDCEKNSDVISYCESQCEWNSSHIVTHIMRRLWRNCEWRWIPLMSAFSSDCGLFGFWRFSNTFLIVRFSWSAVLFSLLSSPWNWRVFGTTGCVFEVFFLCFMVKVSTKGNWKELMMVMAAWTTTPWVFWYLIQQIIALVTTAANVALISVALIGTLDS